ncbi:MAG: c-type cytochrome, partial [Pirellulaceae bacterium]|nr:c-type cytochrome [Pirellulaceae bacterium]
MNMLPAHTSAAVFMRYAGLWLVVVSAPGLTLLAAPPAAVQYETHVAPIFKKHCVACHNPQSMKAELDLSSPEGLFRGSESGHIVDLEKAEEGLLYEMVHEKLMPPEGKPEMSAAEIATISNWV